MSPFYYKEGEGRPTTEWLGQPKDFRDKQGNFLGVTIFSVKNDREQIRVSLPIYVNNSSYVKSERGDLVFPDQEATLDRDGFEVVDARTRKTIAKVIYSEKPISGKFFIALP